MKEEWEALSRNERREKAERLKEDIEMLYNSPDEAPEALREGVAELMHKEDYETAVEYLEDNRYSL
jgi:hypothetical protein